LEKVGVPQKILGGHVGFREFFGGDFGFRNHKKVEKHCTRPWLSPKLTVFCDKLYSGVVSNSIVVKVLFSYFQNSTQICISGSFRLSQTRAMIPSSFGFR
jgi:hypothetical protein